MDTISSSEFRKSFASLKECKEVTVHGHVMGEWIPVASVRYQTIAQIKATLAELERDREGNARLGAGVITPDKKYVPDSDLTEHYREFRPVPKPGKGR